MMSEPRRVDLNGLKTGMATTIVLLVAAFILNWWPLVTIVAIAQLLGALDTPFAPYRLFYRFIVKFFVQPNVIADNPEPHRFAMLVGGLFNSAATLALIAGLDVIGWVLVAIVVVLANLNFWLDFCLGCWMYYRLNRLGVPGFTRSPIQE